MISKMKSLFTFKKTTVPVTNETEEVETIQLWFVRWYKRHDKYSHGIRETAECFASEEKAIAFKKSLENAYKLLRHTSCTKVWIDTNAIEK